MQELRTSIKHGMIIPITFLYLLSWAAPAYIIRVFTASCNITTIEQLIIVTTMIFISIVFYRKLVHSENLFAFDTFVMVYPLVELLQIVACYVAYQCTISAFYTNITKRLLHGYPEYFTHGTIPILLLSLLVTFPSSCIIKLGVMLLEKICTSKKAGLV